jgi:hypothetical protein
MTPEKLALIAQIEALYPPDAPDPKTSAVGNKLMLRARSHVPYDWRQEPVNVLALAAQYMRNHRREQEEQG